MILVTIKAFFDSLGKYFSCIETKIDKQCETDIIKSKRKTEKRSDKQEDLILDMAKLLMKYRNEMSKTDRIRTAVYVSRIKRVN